MFKTLENRLGVALHNACVSIVVFLFALSKNRGVFARRVSY